MSAPNDTPPVAATLLLLRENPFEVLMVRRNSRGTFASSLVFPGGALDPADHGDGWAPLVEDFDDFDPDERSRRIAAIRETWEETSILVGASGDESASTASAAGLAFRDFVEASGARLRLGALTHLAHWVTPETEPRRFDTSFYVAAAPAGREAVADGREIVGAEWAEPSVAAAAARRGEWPIIFPTLMNLDRLSEGGSIEAVVASALGRARFTVLPVFEQDENGGRVIVIPAEAGYAVTRFSPNPDPRIGFMALLHRATLVPSKLELVTGWAPQQPWFVGAADAPLATVASFRFDDPDGEVGVETLLVRAGDGPVLQIPLTYRNERRDGSQDGYIGTLEHSVLGTRWVYDATTDPVYLGELGRAILTGGTQVEQWIEIDGVMTEREPTARVVGSGTQALPDLDAIVLEVVRVPGEAGTTGQNATGPVLTGTWTDHPEPTVLAIASTH